MGATLAHQVSALESRGKAAMKAISLLYHDVVMPGHFDSSGFTGGDADIYKFARPEFERHLEAIAQAPRRGEVTVVNSVPGKVASGSLLLTFDDGGVTAMSIAALLESYGWRGHFFITTDYIGKPAFLSKDQIRELYARGHVVGSHSCSHPARMSRCPPEQLQREWLESTRALTEILGATSTVASVPGGYYARRVAIAAAAAGIEVLFNSEPTTRIKQVAGCRVFGRYSIRQGVSANTVGTIASGNWPPRVRQYLYWNSKKIAKRLGGSYYLTLRKWALRKDPIDDRIAGSGL